MRRVLDVVVSLLAGLLLLPVIAAVALAVLVTMGRPVLFRQERAGLGGVPFRLLKFRTMRPPSEFGQPDAARTPAVGRFLRASSLDELPQLWNILRGDMSLIGPRPALPLQVEHYTARQRGRLAVRPGLTGWAQVNGRNAISWPERIELDLWWIDHRGAGLDLRIVALTALRTVRPSGVHGVDGINDGFPTASGTVVDFWGARPAAPGSAHGSVPAPRAEPGVPDAPATDQARTAGDR
ncbi:sugar transferase [Pseudonocardia sp. C8]|uniref:sugar transferase n=1 Tax=Pseudonocardia sp. C8 TaxID=2762759 RepID=UPI001642D122|nr:sugar transferase [Pseudonocardia sp. C8]MBC3193493.1 sugar transferase [Pseudonocardia sp. C8]